MATSGSLLVRRVCGPRRVEAQAFSGGVHRVDAASASGSSAQVKEPCVIRAVLAVIGTRDTA
jgi:hypothetical protein